MKRTFSTIGVRVSRMGVHSWENAPAHRAYLALPHPHVFRFTATVNVHHNDRDVEFHDLQEMLCAGVHSMYAQDDNGVLQFGKDSCEQIALELFGYLDNRNVDVLSVTVQEDDVCWGTVTADE